jgi:hypothetical protein
MSRVLSLLFCVTLLAACASDNVLTQEEIKIQNAADEQVARILFDNDLTTTASYNVHKDGSVVIKFDESVAFDTYNEVVKTLRDNQQISRVRAEQGGKEVCPLAN